MNNKYFIYGLHPIEAVLLKHPERILHVYLKQRQDERLLAILKTLQTQQLSFTIVAEEALDRFAAGGNHQGVVAHCQPPKVHHENDLKVIVATPNKIPLLLILDGIQDPHNLGACLRTADAVGVDAVIAPKDRSVGLTATVSKVACGAVETVPFIQVTNLARTLGWLKEQGIWLFALSDSAEKNLYEENFKIPLAFVLGNEEKGLRRLTREHCDFFLKIPMQGYVSSLNVSVASAVCLYEALRQRGLTN